MLLLPCVADCCVLYNVCKVQWFVLTVIKRRLLLLLLLLLSRTTTEKYWYVKTAAHLAVGHFLSPVIPSGIRFRTSSEIKAVQKALSNSR